MLESLKNNECTPYSGMALADFLFRHDLINVEDGAEVAEFRKRCHRQLAMSGGYWQGGSDGE